MLDLSNGIAKLYEIKDVEGDILKIKKPPQKLFNIMKDLNGKDEIDQLAVIYDIFQSILNLNINGKTYTKEYVEQFDIVTVGLVIKDYFEFVGEELGK